MCRMWTAWAQLSRFGDYSARSPGKFAYGIRTHARWHGCCETQNDSASATLTSAPTKRSALAAQILAYLLERPTAADSVRWACAWWVGSETPAGAVAVE